VKKKKKKGGREKGSRSSAALLSIRLARDGPSPCGGGEEKGKGKRRKGGADQSVQGLSIMSLLCSNYKSSWLQLPGEKREKEEEDNLVAARHPLLNATLSKIYTDVDGFEKKKKKKRKKEKREGAIFPTMIFSRWRLGAKVLKTRRGKEKKGGRRE